MAQPKVNLYALSELKNTSDDAVPHFMKKVGFKQSHVLTDVRLALGFSASAIAGATFYYDWTLGFEKVKSWTLYAVIAYFVLNSLLTWWIWWVEGGKVYVGEKDGVKVAISSHADKFTPIYQLKIATTYPGNSTPEVVEVKNPFAGWFDQQGLFVVKPFQAFLQNSIPVLAAGTPEATGSIRKGRNK